MTKDFKVFLQQFSEKIESARIRSGQIEQKDIGRLDDTIQGMLDLADKVYGEDVQALLKRLEIQETLEEMRSVLEGHLCYIGNISIDHGHDLLRISYNGQENKTELLDIPSAMTRYFKVEGSIPEYYFLTAYLARNDNYDVIQIYNFLRLRTH